ncbi:MAG: hypothetical protein M3Z25_15475 [Actinomycetota bacterium]|nr:hypothetical protein [Actinomycetota bacterium]
MIVRHLLVGTTVLVACAATVPAAFASEAATTGVPPSACAATGGKYVAESDRSDGASGHCAGGRLSGHPVSTGGATNPQLTEARTRQNELLRQQADERTEASQQRVEKMRADQQAASKHFGQAQR